MKRSTNSEVWRIIIPTILALAIIVGCQPTSLSGIPNNTPRANQASSSVYEPNLGTPTIILEPTATIEPTSLAVNSPVTAFPTPITMPDLSGAVNMTYDEARQEVVAFGGYDPTCNECSETWVWNATAWQRLDPPTSPFGRREAGFAYDGARKESVLFGSSHDPLANDTWVWDGQNWQEKHPAESPPARWGQAGNILVYDAARQVVLLFGGMTRGASTMHPAYLNDTWLWNGQTWTQVNSEPAPPPSQYNGVYMAYDNANQVVVLLDSNTTWTWNGSIWNKQNPSHQPPGLPYGAMGYDQMRQQTVLLGGALNSYWTWVWDGNDWRQVETPDSHLDLGTFPELHMIYDTKNRELLLFAIDKSFVVWAWKGDGWQKLYESILGSQLIKK